MSHKSRDTWNGGVVVGVGGGGGGGGEEGYIHKFCSKMIFYPQTLTSWPSQNAAFLGILLTNSNSSLIVYCLETTVVITDLLQQSTFTIRNPKVVNFATIVISAQVF